MERAPGLRRPVPEPVAEDPALLLYVVSEIELGRQLEEMALRDLLAVPPSACRPVRRKRRRRFAW